MSLGPHLLLALMEGTVAAFVLALTALGLALVFGVMRIVNVAHGEFFMLGAVLAIDRVILRRFNYQPEATIVATIGLLYIIQQLVLIFYGPNANSVAAPIDFRVQLPWFGYSGYKLVVAGIAALLLLATWYGIAKTRIGLVMRATQFDSETAQAFGIPVDRVYAAVFALGAMLAAIAGVLIVPIKQAYYLMGLDPLLLSFIVVIIGGLGSLRGAVIAAFVIGISDGVISVFFSPNLSKILATLLVALVLIFRPEGLFGGKAR